MNLNKKRAHKRKHRKKRPSGLQLVLLLGLVAGFFGAGVLGIKIVGSRLEMGDAPENYGSLEGRFEPVITTTFNGSTYQYSRGRFENVLLIGVDRDQLNTSQSDVRGSGQADFMMLLAIDGENRKVIPIQFDRDTYTEVQVYGAFGNPAGSREMQMGLSYAFGDGSEESCRNTVKAVSDLLGGIPIDYYLALDMDGIAAFNDALGGVIVTLQDDFSALDPAMTEGATLKLNGEQAEIFVRGRMGISQGTNVERMERQRVFMAAALDIFYSKMDEDLNFFTGFLDAISDHTYMNMDRGWLINTAYSASSYEMQNIRTIAGAHTLGADGFVEFHPDTDALRALVVNTFYK